GVSGGCSSPTLVLVLLVLAVVVPMNDTSGSTPLAQSCWKAFRRDAGVMGCSGSPIRPGVPSPNRKSLKPVRILFSNSRGSALFHTWENRNQQAPSSSKCPSQLYCLTLIPAL